MSLKKLVLSGLDWGPAVAVNSGTCSISSVCDNGAWAILLEIWSGTTKFLKFKNVDLVFLQETHLKQVDISRFHIKIYKVISYSCTSNELRGLFMVVKRKLDVKIGISGGDGEGRFCYAVSTLSGTKFCVSSVYAPSVFNPAFFDGVKLKLLDLADSAHCRK